MSIKLTCYSCNSELNYDKGDIDKEEDEFGYLMWQYIKCKKCNVLVWVKCKDAIELDNSPLSGNWRFNNSVLCNGTLRILREDFDTSPSDKIKSSLMDWICNTLNNGWYTNRNSKSSNAIDWDYLPDKIISIAKNSTGVINGFRDIPTLYETNWSSSDFSEIINIKAINNILENIPWDQSLMIRQK